LSYFNGTLGYRQLGTPVYQPTGKDKVSKIPDEWKEVYEQKNLLEPKGEYSK
jgi:adenine-specific DNA-methyltransferase